MLRWVGYRAVRVQVLAEHPEVPRTAVSQFTKAQGPAGADPDRHPGESGDAAAVATLARRAGMRVERRSPGAIRGHEILQVEPSPGQ